MVALHIQDKAAPTWGNCEALHRAALIERMSAEYVRIARSERVLVNIGTILRDDLVLLPLQCEAVTKHLLALRGACQEAHHFYATLAPAPMQVIAPWGTRTKLAILEEQLTELILLLIALEPISTEQSYQRVSLHVMIRHLFPSMFANFDETKSQLAALIVKARERGAEL